MRVNMKKLLIIILLLLISTTASAVDWRVVAVKSKEIPDISVDYNSVTGNSSGYLVFKIKSSPEQTKSLSPQTILITVDYAVSCSSNDYRSLVLTEHYKNGKSKTIYSTTFAESEPTEIISPSIMKTLQGNLCRDFTHLVKGSHSANQSTLVSKLLPKGINSVDWRFLVADTENGEKFWVTTESVNNFDGGIVGFVSKFDYKTPRKLASGNTYMYMVQYIALDCNKHTQDNISTEFFDGNENIVEAYNKDTSEISLTKYELKTFAGWAEATVCPIGNSKPVYQSAPNSNQSNKPDTSYATGTGWQIGKYHLITANHVIENANSIFVSVKENDIREATVVAKDNSNDLALIRVKTPLTTTPLTLATKQVKLGSKVAVIGYPLPDILGSKVQATSGEISGLTGLGDDIRFYQISAAVQSGNSGGPLLNQQGEVIGVVSSKLNDVNMLKERGELPQNVNFAVKSNYIQALIESAGIEQYKTSKKSVKIEDAIDYSKNSVYLIITSTNKK